jgi:hypothetical protein
MSAIHDVPPASSFGYEFNYAVWTPGTHVILASVPWDASYRDVVWYETTDAAIRDISGSVGSIIISQMTFAAMGRPVKLPIPFSKALGFNYLIARNPAQPVKGDSPTNYFYFITDIQYVAPNTTMISLQLDVWQTYSRAVHYGRSYVERGHIGIAAAQTAGHTYDHLRVYDTVPEGIDTGTDMVVRSSYEHVLADPRGDRAWVLIASTISLTEDYGVSADPIFTTSWGATVEGLPHGCEFYCMTIDEYYALRNYLRDFPWVAQGIVSVTLIPPSALSNPTGQTAYTANKGKGPTVGRAISVLPKSAPFTLIENVMDAVRSRIPDRYKYLTKLCMSPYTMIEVTTYTGTPILLKPEMMMKTGLTLKGLNHITPPNPRFMFTIEGYLSGAGLDNDNDSEYMDMMLGITAPPTMTITNNAGALALASQAHSIQYSFQSADWSQHKAMMGAENAQRNANAGIALANDTTQMTADYNTRKVDYTSLNATVGAGFQTAASVASMNPIQAVGAGYNLFQTYDQPRTLNQMANEQSMALNDRNRRYATETRDNNFNLAAQAAKGDYQNAIAGINAKMADTRIVQPTTIGQSGGEAFNYVVDKWSVVAKVKGLSDGAMRFLGEFWLRYGYAMNVFTKPPQNLSVMTHFSYWKLQECTITGASCPEAFRQALRGILEKGVTVWRRKNYIGNTDFGDNKPLGNVRM